MSQHSANLHNQITQDLIPMTGSESNTIHDQRVFKDHQLSNPTSYLTWQVKSNVLLAAFQPPRAKKAL